MARTRLRGLEIGGVQIGIEVPESYEWEWPDGPVAEFQCLPREPEVHVGLRVAEVASEDLGGECYAIGPWTFEVARVGSDWRLGLSVGGRRAQLASFDRDFEAGEVTVCREMAAQRAYPLRGPLDEWIVLHRTVARGGLCLAGSAMARDGQAIVRLGATGSRATEGWSSPATSLLGRNAVLVREVRGQLRLFRTPWSRSLDAALGFEAPVCEFEKIEEAEHAYVDLLDASHAAERLVTHAIVPLCDDRLLDRVLRNARCIGRGSRVIERGESAASGAPMAWRSPQLQGAFAPPRGGL